MQTVSEARSWAAAILAKARVRSPALSADLLLGFTLGWDRVRIISHTEQPITEDLWNHFKTLVARHASGEPLHYITGEREFYGLSFRVTPAVLIPRPETEILVEKAIELIQSHSSPARFVDVGAGSGCIAVSIAHAVSSCIGWAVDISNDALKIACENAARHGVADRIQFARGDLLECFLPEPRFDFVLSNPPYVPLSECDNLPLDVRDFEPHLALFGGESGLEIYSRLIPGIPSLLVPGGYLLVESGAGQAEQIRELAEKAGLSVEMILNDLQGIPRCLVARKIPRRNNG
jgi:release factor glutamine methyltransferase